MAIPDTGRPSTRVTISKIIFGWVALLQATLRSVPFRFRAIRGWHLKVPRLLCDAVAVALPSLRHPPMAAFRPAGALSVQRLVNETSIRHLHYAISIVSHEVAGRTP
jgi:hypothetical protein